MVADNRGEFVISGLDAGNHELHVKRIGYQPVVVPITLPRDEPLIITLGSIPRLLDSVRIQARGPVARYTGVVLDDAEQPVADAEVIAAGASDLNVRTDAQGHFRLLKAQKGTLMLRVRKFGYTPKRLQHPALHPGRWSPADRPTAQRLPGQRGGGLRTPREGLEHHVVAARRALLRPTRQRCA